MTSFFSGGLDLSLVFGVVVEALFTFGLVVMPAGLELVFEVVVADAVFAAGFLLSAGFALASGVAGASPVLSTL